MTKRRRKDREVARLRREVEVLRAQLAGGQKISPATEVSKEPEPAETPKTTKEPKVPSSLTLERAFSRRSKVAKAQPTISTKGATPAGRQGPAFGWQSVDPRFIKADLLKSGILTLIALGAIVALTIIL